MQEIREERAGDEDEIRRVVTAAFGRDAEARIVDALRTAGAVKLSLVLVEDGAIVAHVLFSPVTIDGQTALGLAPVAVLPSRQRASLGTQLITAALRILEARGHAIVIVLGHPEYYPRFGFVRASLHGIRWEQPCNEEAFMVLELKPGALAGVRGVVRYRPELTA